MDLETKTLSLNSSRPSNTNKRLESRIEELQNQLSQSTKDSSRLRTADKGTREVGMQLQESERQRARLEEELRSQESRVATMRQEMDEMVGDALKARFSGLTPLIPSHSRRKRATPNYTSAGQSAKRLITSRKL